jgi:hypothetical protein
MKTSKKVKLSGKQSFIQTKVNDSTICEMMDHEDENGNLEFPSLNDKMIDELPAPETKKNGKIFIPTIQPATSIQGFNPDLGKVQQVIELHKKGFSNQEIIAMGFNKSTVNNQVRNYRLSKMQNKK